MTTWSTAALTEGHGTTGFDCGKPDLDDWLRTAALRAQHQGTARTYVWTAPDDTRVVAYYSIAPTQVAREEVSRRLSGGVSVIPSYLLARLAVDRTLHGRGLGGQLLLNALETIVAAAGMGGGRLIVVDAIDEAARRFYLHLDFVPIEGSARLYLKIATARAALGRD